MTRTEAARALGLTRGELKDRERQRAARPALAPGGEALYDEAEIGRLRQQIDAGAVRPRAPQSVRPAFVPNMISPTPGTPLLPAPPGDAGRAVREMLADRAAARTAVELERETERLEQEREGRERERVIERLAARALLAAEPWHPQPWPGLAPAILQRVRQVVLAYGTGTSDAVAEDMGIALAAGWHAGALRAAGDHQTAAWLIESANHLLAYRAWERSQAEAVYEAGVAAAVAAMRDAAAAVGRAAQRWADSDQELADLRAGAAK